LVPVGFPRFDTGVPRTPVSKQSWIDPPVSYLGKAYVTCEMIPLDAGKLHTVTGANAKQTEHLQATGFCGRSAAFGKKILIECRFEHLSNSPGTCRELIELRQHLEAIIRRFHKTM